MWRGRIEGLRLQICNDRGLSLALSAEHVTKIAIGIGEGGGSRNGLPISLFGRRQAVSLLQDMTVLNPDFRPIRVAVQRSPIMTGSGSPLTGIARAVSQHYRFSFESKAKVVEQLVDGRTDL